MKNNFFTKLSHKTGLNYAVVFAILSRVIQGAGGLISIFFVVKYLNKVEQGYFYTFSSILALQVFFELGLTSIITQYAAHEFAKLKFSDKTTLGGNDYNLSRIASLLHISIKWFSVLSFFLFILLTLVGYCFFGYFNNEKSVNWILPWMILTFTSSINLLFTPILSFLEGLGKIKEVAFIRMVQYTLQTLLVLALLHFDFKLYSSPLATLFSVIILPCFVLFSYRRKLLINIWKSIKTDKISYRNEILPFQWKISLSWISGYFIYQLFNPIVFALEGAIVAGQMGLSLAVFNGIQSISLSWLNTKIPSFSVLIANKKFKELDSLFNKTSIASSIVTCIGVLAFFFILMICINFKLEVVNRFLPINFLIMLGVSVIANQYVAGLAIYLRCHKKEPMLFFSIIVALLVAFGMFIAGQLQGIAGIVSWYAFVIIAISLPWAYVIFIRKRKEWHSFL